MTDEHGESSDEDQQQLRLTLDRWLAEVRTVADPNDAQYAGRGVSGLAEAKVEPSDFQLDRLADIAHKSALQDHDFRDRFFSTVRLVLIAALASSVLIMAAYIVSEWGDISATAIVSFNAAVVVNILGLALILARNLFPDGGQKRSQ